MQPCCRPETDRVSPILRARSDIIRHSKNVLGLLIQQPGNHESPARSCGDSSSSNKDSFLTAQQRNKEFTASRDGCHVTISLIFRRLGFSLVLQFPATQNLVPLSLIVGMPSNKNWTTYRQSRFPSVHCLD